jgi:phage antirepressor YoqD-like protein
MNELQMTGKQRFMEKEIPVILGGFGEGKKCISDKAIAMIHEQRSRYIRELITNNIKRFTVDVDIIDIKQRVAESGTLELLQKMDYAKQSITQAEHIYILSERGYAKLIKIMETDLAWMIHDKLMDEYFMLREVPKGEALIALAVVEAQRILEEKERQIEQMKPKAEYFDALVDRKLMTSLRDTAKELGVQERLFIKFLLDRKYVYRDQSNKLRPFAGKNQGLFELKEFNHNEYSGLQTLVTPKGRETFRLLIKKYMGDSIRCG